MSASKPGVPIGHPRFHELLAEMARMRSRKGSDYANPQDFLSNLRKCERFGVPAHIGAFVRLSDKWERLQNLIAREVSTGAEPACSDETVEDTLMDFAAYALLIRILREERAKLVAEARKS